MTNIWFFYWEPYTHVGENHDKTQNVVLLWSLVSRSVFPELADPLFVLLHRLKLTVKYVLLL